MTTIPNPILSVLQRSSSVEDLRNFIGRLDDRLKKISPTHLVLITAVGVVALQHLKQKIQPNFGETFAEKAGRLLTYAFPDLGKSVEKLSQKPHRAFCKDFLESWKKLGDMTLTIPQVGITPKEILKRFYEWNEEKENRLVGTVKSGELYANVYQEKLALPPIPDNLTFTELDNRLYALLKYDNKMHKGDFALGDFLNFQVIQMAANAFRKVPFTKPDLDIQGFVTPGGSYSLFHSIWCHLQLAVEEKGICRSDAVLIAPDTIHASVDKSCAFLHIKLIKIKTDRSGEFSLDEMEDALDTYQDNVIALFGSLGCFSLGKRDPLEEMGVLAVKAKVGFHVDACLVGYIAEYLGDEGYFLDIPGVTGFSVDPHKNANAPKNISLAVFRKRADQKHNLAHYGAFALPDWTGSVYASEGIAGSSSLVPIASAYAAMVAKGKEGFKSQALAISELILELNTFLLSQTAIEVLAQPKMNVVAFAIKPHLMLPGATYFLAKEMKKHGVTLNPIKGDAVHFCATQRSAENRAKTLMIFKEAFRKAIAQVPLENARLKKRNKETFQEWAAIYCSLESAMEPVFARQSIKDFVLNVLFGKKVARESTKYYVDASHNPYVYGEKN